MMRTSTIDLPIPLEYPPMEAALTERLPEGDGWIYEPKWDGFRCLAFREASLVELRSKASKPLTRYFPDVAAALLEIPAKGFVLDGEIVIPVGSGLSFDDLLLRIHPAESRVRKLAASHPALFVAFDLLVDERRRDLTALPLEHRRKALEEFAAKHFPNASGVRLSPATSNIEQARRWLDTGRVGLDGVMAKRTELPYQSGTRTGMIKVKRLRTADCVIGGFRWKKAGGRIASLLLGLYGEDGMLHHVGFCSSLNEQRRREAELRLMPLRGGEGFTAREPTGHSRWRKEGTAAWEPVKPEIVIEVQYDHFTGGRFRHGTRFLRWRPDKPPGSCTLNQVEKEGSGARGMLLSS